jgi:F0F1-type ATP synthase assembly protein I
LSRLPPGCILSRSRGSPNMPSDNKPGKTDSAKPSGQGVQNTSSQLATAMELPFTFVGAVIVGGLIGYFLDKWLHTSPWLMIVFGCFGFAGGILEISRRFRPKDSS